ncbi:MAG: hypothetical protein JNL13_00400 [Chitinophagaceae bacterium]|nr:hypothetical protein [Chitinophagaceae bacterium]
MSKYSFSLLLFLLSFSCIAQDQDSLAVPAKASAPAAAHPKQLRFSFDVARILMNRLSEQKSSYEGGLDYYLKNETYFTAEFGSGNSVIDYPDLKYKSNNIFVRAGIDKSLFERRYPQDWGMGFIGFRYAVGMINRNEAAYTTNDGLGGITSGITPAHRFTAHWFELTGGMRVELFKNTFAGWNVRFKFLLNQKAMGELKPAYIAGYGAGEKGTAFDYNFYLAFALRWSAKH